MPSKWMHVLVIQIEETLFIHVIIYMICSNVFFLNFHLYVTVPESLNNPDVRTLNFVPKWYSCCIHFQG